MDSKTKLNRTQRIALATQWKKLLANGKNRYQDHAPVVKYFDPCGAATWLISEVDDDGIAFGLCDLGMGCPELGNVSLEEMISIGRIERDLHFKGKRPLSWYADQARKEGRISA